MAYIGKNPRLKSIVSTGDSIENLTLETRVEGRLVYADGSGVSPDKGFYWDDGTNLVLVGSGSGSLEIEKTEATHGFALLDAIYHDGANWLKAQANNGDTLAEFIVTEVVDANNFKAAKFGELTATAHGLTVGEHYFLDDAVAGGAVVTAGSSYSAPLFYVEDANTIHLEVYRPADLVAGGSAGDFFDRLIGSGGDADLNASVAAATAGDSVGHLTEVLPAVSAAQTINKQIGVHGGGNGSVINGNVTFSAGCDGSSLKDLKVDGSIVIDAGVKNLIIKDIWLTIGNTITDNSGNSSNLIQAVVEE